MYKFCCKGKGSMKAACLEYKELGLYLTYIELQGVLSILNFLKKKHQQYRKHVVLYPFS